MTGLSTDRGWPEQRAPAPASDEISEPSTSGTSHRDDGFIQHKVRCDAGNAAAAPRLRTHAMLAVPCACAGVRRCNHHARWFQVLKTDTLAGLAVKYGIHVSAGLGGPLGSHWTGRLGSPTLGSWEDLQTITGRSLIVCMTSRQTGSGLLHSWCWVMCPLVPRLPPNRRRCGHVPDDCILQVGDIKRANGLLSDSAMFAREFINIPTRQMPIG
jgi:hypothetical protein